MRWIRYSVTGLLGLIVVLAAAGALYQFIGTMLISRNCRRPENSSMSAAIDCISTAPVQEAPQL